MASLNEVTLLGNCGRDPETRHMADGKPVCNVSIATTTKRKDKNTGDLIEDTQWHRVTLYDKLADIAGKYVTKGSQVLIKGRIKYGKFTNKDGIEQHTVDIVATDLLLVGSRSDAPRENKAPPSMRVGEPRKQPVSSGFDDMDDDVPF